MQDHLLSSSSKFARSSLQAYLDSDWDVFLLHAATSLEHLLKSYLSSYHPALIASHDLDSLLHACGRGDLTSKPVGRTKTIGMDTALKWTMQLMPGLRVYSDDLTFLSEVRNGIAHLGLAQESSQAEQVFGPYLKAATNLLDALSVEHFGYWGDFEKMVDSHISKVMLGAQRRVSQRITAARRRFADRYGNLPEEQSTPILEAIEAAYSIQGAEATQAWQLTECPACATQAIVYGTVFDLPWERVSEWPEGQHSLFGMPMFMPGHLSCQACNLKLSGQDELKAAGIPESWKFDPPGM